MNPEAEGRGEYAVFSLSLQGARHRKEGKPCQDASGCLGEGELWALAAADGHGSADYPRSGRGAAFAVEAALETLLDFLLAAEEAPADREAVLRGLEQEILRRWQAMVREELARSPLTPEELDTVSERYRSRYASGTDSAKAYGSTLLAACGNASFWCGIQIGDGSCAAVDRGGLARRPIPWDERCQMNRTTSLCDENAGEEFRHCWSTSPPAAVFLGTDGIDNSYAGAEELLRLYRAIALVWAEQGPETGAAELRGFLPTISDRGSGDDVSLACALRIPPEAETVQRLREGLAT